MKIDIITLLPSLLSSPFDHSIIKRAQQKSLVEINIHDLRDYAEGKHRQVDDYQYGGGAGMVIMAEPIARCIDALKAHTSYDELIYMCPDGELLNQKICNRLSLKNNLLILCGHYKGIDERIRELYITKEISIGNYVLSGGELPAAVLVDSIVRLIPGVITDETSALFDSYQDNLLAPPVYTRPPDFRGHKVPRVLLSGNFKKIEDWRHRKAVEKTRKRRPELLTDDDLD